MRWMVRLTAVVVLMGLPAGALAGEKKADVERVLSAAREDCLAAEHLDILVNRIGARLTGSDGLQNACEWARDRFKEVGLPGARLEKWGEFPVGFNRGPASGRVVEPEVKTLTFGTNAWTAGTRGIVRGPALLAPENAEQLEAIKAKLPGAYVLLPAATPAGRPGGNAPANPAAEFRKALETACEAAKVAGMIRPTRNDLVLTGGNFKVAWDKLPTIPAINLVKAEYDEIVAQIKAGKSVTLEFDIRNHFKKGPIPLYNVVADLVGSDLPNEYVIVGGHIDSWDGATGTTDNGTGCSTAIEAARILVKSGVKPRRTIRFMLWSGEEQGLLGSKAYVEAHPELLKNISAVLVHDGGTNYLSGIGGTKAMKADLDEAFAPVVGLDPAYPFAVREVPGLRGGGSDHASFLTGGVPGFFWRQSGKAVYNQTHHTQHDTYDRAIPEYQRHSSLVIALGALGIADLDHLLSREAMIAPGGPNAGGGRRGMGLQLDETMKLVDVTEGSPAERAGLKPGDVLLKIDGKPVADREAMIDALTTNPGTKTLVVRREGQEVEVKLTPPAAQP